jgi:Uma2 family endonuclease
VGSAVSRSRLTSATSAFTLAAGSLLFAVPRIHERRQSHWRRAYDGSVRRALDAKLTYDDYAAIPSDGQIYQIVDGEVFVSPAPSPYHQRASKRLQRQLEDYFETSGRGEVFDAPIDLILGPHDIMQPDLVVAPHSAITRRGIEDVPILVVEVLSPSTATFDRQVKARRLAALGVPHYWILDHDARHLECFRNESGVFTLAATADRDATIAAPGFDGLIVDLALLWR